MPSKSGEGAISSNKQGICNPKSGGRQIPAEQYCAIEIWTEPWSSGSPRDEFFLASIKHRDPSIEGWEYQILSHMPPSLDGHTSETTMAKAEVPAIIASFAAM